MERAEQLSTPAVSIPALWWGILIGPIGWALDEGISYAVDQHACSTGRFYLLHAISAASFVLALTGAYVASRQLSKVPPGAHDDGGSPRDRSWFMLRLGILLSLGFALAIIAMAVPRWVLSPCD